MEVLKNTKQGLWLEDSLRKRELTIKTRVPVERYTSIMTIVALASMMKWNLHQMDVKTNFLNGVIEEEVYIEQPQGFEVEYKRTHVCKLKKDLYGLKKAPRAWYGRIDRIFYKIGLYQK